MLLGLAAHPDALGVDIPDKLNTLFRSKVNSRFRSKVDSQRDSDSKIK